MTTMPCWKILPPPSTVPRPSVAAETRKTVLGHSQRRRRHRSPGIRCAGQAYQRLCEDGFAAHLIPGVVVRHIGQVRRAALKASCPTSSEHIYPSLLRTTDEIDNLLRGLEGRFVPPGPSGAPTRGMVNVLPTGRNFYSVDPRALPSPTAWDVGKSLGDALLQKYLDEEGGYPEMVGVVVWGTSAMRTHGDDIAQIPLSAGREAGLAGGKPTRERSGNNSQSPSWGARGLT